jgi:hypothetical protein
VVVVRKYPDFKQGAMAVAEPNGMLLMVLVVEEEEEVISLQLMVPEEMLEMVDFMAEAEAVEEEQTVPVPKGRAARVRRASLSLPIRQPAA